MSNFTKFLSSTQLATYRKEVENGYRGLQNPLAPRIARHGVLEACFTNPQNCKNMAFKPTLTMFNMEHGARYRCRGYQSGTVHVYYAAPVPSRGLSPGCEEYWIVSTHTIENCPVWMRRVFESHPVRLVYSGAGDRLTLDNDLRSALLLG